jgi:hypothetical protein
MFRLRFRSLVSIQLVLNILLWTAAANASAIYGTLSNFDIYNTTPEPVEGAEIELEGCDSTSIGGYYPSHFDTVTINDYNEFGKTGTRIRFEGYNFDLPVTQGSLPTNPNPVSTNGHELTNSAGGEHFGFWLNAAQPTETRFFWLNKDNGVYERVGNLPEIVPGPVWDYIPPDNPGEPAIVQAAIKVPEPGDVIDQRPDSTWMKVFKVKLPASQAPADPAQMQALLLRLISDANAENEQPDVPLNDLVPEGDDPVEVESEWELLEGGKAPKEKVAEDEVDEDDPENDKLIIRRYEFYKYTGLYDEEHEPITEFLDPGDLLEPPAGELGSFISSNMVAAVLNPIGLPGDYNNDLIVDAADYVMWHKTDGTPYGYDEWRTNFGRSAGGLANEGIPEPATILLVALALLVGRLAYRTSSARR